MMEGMVSPEAAGRGLSPAKYITDFVVLQHCNIVYVLFNNYL
jgi:hypothetical protein